MWPFTRRKPKTPRADGYYNDLTGVGTARDKRLGGAYVADIIDWATARELWIGSDMAARVIETIPREMFRQGHDVKLQGGGSARDVAEELDARLEELGAVEHLERGLEFERAYGGGAVWPVINDGAGDLAKPLNEDRIPGISHLLTFEPRELLADTWYDDPREAKFGRPKTYRVQPIAAGAAVTSSLRIHESRLIIFPGIQVSREQISGIVPGWGASVLSRFFHVLRDFDSAWASTSALLQDFAQAVYRIKDLAGMMSRQEEDLVLARLRNMEISRSVLRGVLLDVEEDFKREPTPMTGIPEVLDKFAVRLAAAGDLPVTVLMGQSPAGMNATGESDRAFMYDRVSAEQERRARPALERLVKLLLSSKDGPTGGKEPDVWSVEFRPLWQQDDNAEADRRLKIAQADQVYFDMGAVHPEEIAQSRFGGDAYNPDTKLDPAFRAELEKMREAKAAAPAGADEVAAQGAPEGAPPGAPAGEPPAEDETEGERQDGGRLPGLREDHGNPEDPSYEHGGGGAASSGRGGDPGDKRARDKRVRERAKELKSKPTHELAQRVLTLVKDPEHAPSATQLRGSEEYQAHTKALKTRGVGTFGALERAARADHGNPGDPSYEHGGGGAGSGSDVKAERAWAEGAGRASVDRALQLEREDPQGPGSEGSNREKQTYHEARARREREIASHEAEGGGGKNPDKHRDLSRAHAFVARVYAARVRAEKK